MQNRCCKSYGCTMMPTMGMGGYCHAHQREDAGYERKLKEKERKSAVKKITSKSLHAQQDEIGVPKGTQELQRWFNDRHREMKGSCQHCGGKSEKGRGTYKCSIAHILPKAHFKSVATHPDNWIELCFYGKNSCHTNFDNYMLDITDLNCFDEVIRKFVAIYPDIAIAERRRIPQVLLNYLEVEK
jgi:hypothetical protein